MGSTPGKLIESVTVQPHQGTSALIKKGQYLRIVDLEGQQVAEIQLAPVRRQTARHVGDLHVPDPPDHGFQGVGNIAFHQLGVKKGACT